MQYFILSYKLRPIGESGESCKSEYDLSDSCASCGTGARLVGNLKTKGLTKAKKDFFETVDGDFIVSKKLYNHLNKDLINFNLKQVIDTKNNYLDYYHFTSKINLPKFKSDSTGFEVEGQCQTCKRNGYFSNIDIGNISKNIPSIIHPYIFNYDKDETIKLKEQYTLNSWECFGLSNISESLNHPIRYARPLTIVGKKIKDIFDAARIKNVEFEKINIY